MEFLANHSDRHQQVTVLQNELSIRYAKLQMQYEALLAELNGNGLSLAKGTATDGFQKLLPLLVPVYDAIVEKSVSAQHWHADETGWKVFEAVEGKKNHRWFLWIFHERNCYL